MRLGLPGRDTTGSLFDRGIQILLCFLLLAVLGGIAIGVIRIFIDLFRASGIILSETELPQGFKGMLIDTLGVLAMVEVYRTAMTYFLEGRVKVTYIIDTVLVATLTEMLAFWYKEVQESRMMVLLALVVVLMLLRILAIRFSPNRRGLTEGL
jgi:uncharacterized membrane protein (DUF373 family)